MVHHVDPEVLALLALGEQPDDVASIDERDHLDVCAPCRDEVASLAAVAATGREVTPDDAPRAPSSDVWAGIHRELGLSDDVRELGDLGRPADWATSAPTVAPMFGVPARPHEPRGQDAPQPADPGTIDLAARRERRAAGRRRFSGGLVAAAASVALVAGVAGGVLWAGRDGGVSGSETMLAVATLDALPAWDGSSGQAYVQEASDGTRQVVVQMEAPSSDEGFHEVWLIKDDLSGLVSLGVLDGSEGTFPVPDGLDLDQYSLVDVSEEGFDGDPAHSGDSIVRGGLTPA
ncbi:hypothetical protein GCM10025865_09510 [Paraoerskovia sediminicola]|uniref:Anti-sigma K factor RskA C-terminal domain-containing protein n=1 Tax=Paraoerskovia sediminicola TaxID=1138587 RepID=A0ABM8G0S6_9CELL|nr:anti-sigma factor [Paraoerskovia sediminicola]BDZ41652.1 hypothetical protein GCM10025865_09510 [Paraoerskovia sediminicola]